MSSVSTSTRIESGEPIPPRHPDVASWRPATASDIDAVTSLIQDADRVDHPSWQTPREDVEEIFESSAVDASRDTILGFAADGELVAVGTARVHPSRAVRLQAYLDGRVRPSHRGRGIGRELIRWEHERALQALAEADSELPGALFVYAEEGDVPARHLAVRRGLREERWFSTMVRDVAADIPDVVPEADVQITGYDVARHEAVRIARNDAFRDHWGSLETPPERWSHFVGGPLFRPDLSCLAMEGDRVVGFALGSVNEADWKLQGYSSVYVDLVGVVRDRRRRRIAPAVITGVLRAAREAGLRKVVLDVDTESPTGADGLYGRLGFESTERTVALVAHV